MLSYTYTECLVPVQKLHKSSIRILQEFLLKKIRKNGQKGLKYLITRNRCYHYCNINVLSERKNNILCLYPWTGFERSWTAQDQTYLIF
jgi:hypothetical protein